MLFGGCGKDGKGGAVKLAYKIGDTCVSCGTCASTCPVGAIKEGTPYVIEEDVCVECGACAAVCPVSAIEAP